MMSSSSSRPPEVRAEPAHSVEEEEVPTELLSRLTLWSRPNPKPPELYELYGEHPTEEQVQLYIKRYNEYRLAESRRKYAKRWRMNRNIELEHQPEDITSRNKVQQEPFSESQIVEMMGGELTLEIREKYIIPFADITTRSDPRYPESRYVSQTSAGRMKQLVEFFPEGVSIDYFEKIYRQVTGYDPVINGYSFPKDNEPDPKFWLPNVFWIPDNDAHHISARLLFPVESRDNYGGLLKGLLQIYWDLFLVYMRSRKAVKLSEIFSFGDNEQYFFGITGIWFSYGRWGLLSYTQFFEMLLENFDPENKCFKILYLPPEEEGSLNLPVYLVTAGDNGIYAREFENAAVSKFCATIPPKPWRPSQEQTPWRYENLRFVALEALEMEPKTSRVFEVVTAGNIWNFYQFHVIFVKDILERDKLLEYINYLVITETKFSIPTMVVERSLVVFQLEITKMWRRGLVIRRERKASTCSVMDIDTGETNINVQISSLRNITASLVALPVFSIPVRFSIDTSLKWSFIGNPEGNQILGKYLHMLLVAANRGLRLRFHWWDFEATYYIPGVWVVSGHLFDVIENKPIFPQVNIAMWALKKFFSRCTDEKLPEWEEISRLAVDWSIPDMIRRPANLTAMISLYNREGLPNVVDLSTGVPMLLNVDRNCRNEASFKIFMDVEMNGWRPPVPNYTSTTGIRKLTRYEALMHGIKGNLKAHFPVDFYVLPVKSDWTPELKPERGSQKAEKESPPPPAFIYLNPSCLCDKKRRNTSDQTEEVSEPIRNSGNGISKRRYRNRIHFTVVVLA